MKTIVILSTEPWGKMLLSKMHYAIELARLGNKVFFVEPPRKSTGVKVAGSSNSEYAGLTIVRIKKLPFGLFLRHKLPFVYNLAVNNYVKRIRETIGVPIDEVWNFNPNFFINMKSFGAKKNILLLYDFYQGKHIETAVKNADALLSPSLFILDHYDKGNKPVLKMQHGLGEDFVNKAKQVLETLSRNDTVRKPLKIGYVGNLLRAAMNTAVAEDIIKKHTEVEFHFWGPYSFKDNNVSDANLVVEQDRIAFIHFLEQCKNVFLHGVRRPHELASEIAGMDGFLFLYDSSKDVNGASNSHKIIEYLSTGKVVISSNVSNYKDTGLLEMTDEKDIPALFEKVVENIHLYNNPAKQKERIEFAMDNSYSNQVRRIGKFIAGI